MTERTRFRAFLGARCPRCKEGNVFVHGAFHLRYYRTHTKCPVCGLIFEREPSFFTGAMYISYFMNVALVLTGLAISQLFLKDSPLWISFALFVPIYLPFIPLIFRYSRLLLLYLVGNLK